MNVAIEKDSLVEIEFELNRKEILHFRSLITENSSDENFTVLTPPPVSHGYVFKPGDPVDLYVSLLGKGDTDHTLHIKARVAAIEKTALGSQLHLKSSGFARPIAQTNLHILRSKSTLLLHSENSPLAPIPATLRSVSLNSAHLSTQTPLSKDGLWKTEVVIDGFIFNLQGRIELVEGKSPLENGYAAILHFTDMSPDMRREMAGVIEAVQKNYIRARSGLTFHEVFNRSDLQDPLILEHLVPRSWHRIVLDMLELTGWAFLVLICFDIVLASPPEMDFFDRFFKLKPNAVWDQERLRSVPLFFAIELIIFFLSLFLHQFIYYRGNTRVRWRLWLMSILTLLIYLSIRTLL